MKKPRILIAINWQLYPTLLLPADLSRIGEVAEMINPDPPTQSDKAFLLREIGGADIVLTSWDTACLDAEIMAEARHLKLVCHAAGSVRPVVSDALWRAGVRVTSGAAAISHGVAEYCLGLTLMASKRVFWLADGVRQGFWMEPQGCFGGIFELYRQNVGVIGAGHIGARLIKLFGNFDCKVLLYDPYCPDERAAEIGCRKVSSLEELFASCRVVSLNAPTNEGTRHMLRGHHFASLRPGSVFINTAGSIQIHEAEFLAELRRGRFVACIDRCEEEPCALDHPYRTLPNVILTPHIAGVAAENRLRIGTMVVDDTLRFLRGDPMEGEVTEGSLATMA